MSDSLAFARYVLDWIGVHASVVLMLLIAIVPVMALLVAGYTVHVLGRRDKGRKR